MVVLNNLDTFLPIMIITNIQGGKGFLTALLLLISTLHLSSDFPLNFYHNHLLCLL